MNTGKSKLVNAVAEPDISGAAVPLVGEVIAMADHGGPMVKVPGRSEAVRAQTAVPLDASQVGRRVILVFERGDPARPIVVGVLQERSSGPTEPLRNVEVLVDDERVTVAAREVLVLRCGAARITLTSAGKVVIEGTYVSTKSTGVNRITGGSVQIN